MFYDTVNWNLSLKRERRESEVRKKLLILGVVLISLFVGVSSVSASVSTTPPAEIEDFENAEELSAEADPQYLPALAAIGQAARVAEAGVKAATAVGKAVGAGFAAAAGADAYNRVVGTLEFGEAPSNVEVAEVAFD